MCDRVSPSVEVVQPILTRAISPIVMANLIPKIKAQTIEIRADRTRMRIASVELAIQRKLCPKCRSQDDGINNLHDMANSL